LWGILNVQTQAGCSGNSPYKRRARSPNVPEIILESQPGMITEIQTNFYRITLPMPYRLRHVHAYALVQGSDVALFDTGMNMPGSYEKIEEDLKSRT
jgi:hypothetical protein